MVWSRASGRPAARGRTRHEERTAGNRDELASLSHKLGRRPFDLIYETLQRRCAKILESGPITENHVAQRPQPGALGRRHGRGGEHSGRVFDLTICHAVEPNRAYRDRAMEELRNLIRFSTWTDPSHKDLQADLCTGEACATVAVALDWLAEEMTEADRLRCVKAIREKGLTPYLEAVRTGAFWRAATTTGTRWSTAGSPWRACCWATRTPTPPRPNGPPGPLSSTSSTPSARRRLDEGLGTGATPCATC